jgi:biotin operon repressor
MSAQPVAEAGKGRPAYWTLRWTPQEDARLIVAYNAGASAKEIGLMIDRTENSVTARITKLRDQGAPIAGFRHYHKGKAPICPFITDEDRAWMAYWSQPRAVRRAQVWGGSS